MIGHPIELTAAKVLEGLGGTSGNFCARRLTARIASEADLILTMSERHRDKVLGLAPMQFKRTFTLREAARLAEESGASTVAELADARTRYGVGDAEDIIDPIGADGAVFQEVGSEIAELLGPLVKRLIIPSRRDLSPSAPATSSDLG